RTLSLVAAIVFIAQNAVAFYHPQTQRWINRDSLGESGFEVLRNGLSDQIGDGKNLFAYVNNEPLSRVDRFGLDGEATIVAEPTLLLDEEAAAALRAKQCRCALLN